LKLGAELDSINKIIIQVKKLSTHVLSKILLHSVVICCLLLWQYDRRTWFTSL